MNGYGSADGDPSRFDGPSPGGPDRRAGRLGPPADRRRPDVRARGAHIGGVDSRGPRPVLRALPQRSPAHGRAGPRRPRPGARRHRRRDLGAGHRQAPRTDDAAGGQPAARRGHVSRRRLLAGDGDRHAGPRQSRSGPRRDLPPPQSGRVSRRRPRSARGRRRRRRAAAGGRHLRARLRQQRRRALDLAGLGGAVPLGRAPDQPPRRRHPSRRSRGGDLPGASRAAAGRPAGRPAVVRLPRRHRHSALLPRGWGVHDKDPSPPELLRLHPRLFGAAGARRARGRRPRHAVRGRRRRCGGTDGPAELRREHRRGPRVGVLHEHRGRASGGAFPGAGGPADRGRLLRETVLGAGGRAAAAQPGLRPLRRRTVRRERSGRAGRDWRPLRRRGPRRHAEPPRDLRLPAGGRRHHRRGGGLRRPDPRQAGPPGVSPPRGRHGHPYAAGLLPRRAPRRRLRRRHPVRAGTDARRPRVPVPHRARPGGRRAGGALSA